MGSTDELAQLKRDVAYLARLVEKHAGGKPELLAIIARYAPDKETRPAAEAPERR